MHPLYARNIMKIIYMHILATYDISWYPYYHIVIVSSQYHLVAGAPLIDHATRSRLNGETRRNRHARRRVAARRNARGNEDTIYS